MSGPNSGSAAHFPDRLRRPLRSTEPGYGDAEASPHLSFKQAKAEHYIACAEHDELAPPDMVEQLQAYLLNPGQR